MVEFDDKEAIFEPLIRPGLKITPTSSTVSSEGVRCWISTALSLEIDAADATGNSIDSIDSRVCSSHSVTLWHVWHVWHVWHGQGLWTAPVLILSYFILFSWQFRRRTTKSQITARVVPEVNPKFLKDWRLSCFIMQQRRREQEKEQEFVAKWCKMQVLTWIHHGYT